MAGRTLNRRELRVQADQAEQSTAVVAEMPPAAVPLKKRPKAKAAGVAKVKKPRKQKALPRFRARWGLFDSGMKQVAVYDYNQRGAADDKLADLLAKKKGSYFMQIVKEVMPEPAEVTVPACA